MTLTERLHDIQTRITAALDSLEANATVVEVEKEIAQVFTDMKRAFTSVFGDPIATGPVAGGQTPPPQPPPQCPHGQRFKAMCPTCTPDSFGQSGTMPIMKHTTTCIHGVVLGLRCSQCERVTTQQITMGPTSRYPRVVFCGQDYRLVEVYSSAGSVFKLEKRRIDAMGVPSWEYVLTPQDLPLNRADDLSRSDAMGLALLDFAKHAHTNRS